MTKRKQVAGVGDRKRPKIIDGSFSEGMDECYKLLIHPTYVK